MILILKLKDKYKINDKRWLTPNLGGDAKRYEKI